MRKEMNNTSTILVLLLVCFSSFAQEVDEKEKEKALRLSTNLTWDGNKALSEDNFIAAEVDYRKAISKSPDNSAAPYNLGNAYYNNETYNEAFSRFKEAGETSTSKADKHKAYHNMGNVFMKRKDYAKAVEAYKEALRNDPTDEETRYNLALAKELLKKDQDENKQNQDDKDKDKKDQDENKDQDKKDEGENEDKKDQGEDGDKGDEGDQDEEKKDDNSEGDGDNKSDQQKKPEQGDGENEQNQQQPRPNQLSKQQVENLLRAMQNAEKKVQDKIDAKKVKGAKIKNEKDW
ncbi:tetratricopeptide repeat protein [Maribacter dokdonensis]|uniref:tetratricopeptide repeat protein n=1 Tax=Maribacter dokdonensis TaxID=320912 RepID=UPI00273550AB|nr:tetratricopeptide repeat protein [Maribacter dokdonensis]MDP2525991.1 tetratricopeptide repeat protein [Maribacter dokdonensis]